VWGIAGTVPASIQHTQPLLRTSDYTNRITLANSRAHHRRFPRAWR
jgi:hypothetical protein